MTTKQSRGLTSRLQNNLLLHMLDEIEAMTIWALTNGLNVPADLTEEYYFILNNINIPNGTELSQGQGGETDLANDHVEDPPLYIAELIEIHHALTGLITPAKPRTVALMYKEQKKNSLLIFMGPVPLIRQLAVASFIFLFILYGVGQSDFVNSENIAKSILESEHEEQLYVQTFLFSCAGLGAVFSCLFQAMGYVTKGSYDPKYNSAYWVRIILGLMSGLILVEMIPKTMFAGTPMEQFGKPIMALLGGFSATVVYKLLQRFVDLLSLIVDKIPGHDDSKESQKPTPIQNLPQERGDEHSPMRSTQSRASGQSRATAGLARTVDQATQAGTSKEQAMDEKAVTESEQKSKMQDAMSQLNPQPSNAGTPLVTPPPTSQQPPVARKIAARR